AGLVNDFLLEPDGVLWAATGGGLSRLKDGRVATLTSKNGLHCDNIHWLLEDEARSLWMQTACGLLRIARAELDAWAAAVDKNSDPKPTIQVTAFDSSDGIRSRGIASAYHPSAGRSPDGKLWFTNADGFSFIDPRRLSLNTIPPPVHIEQVTADHKSYDPDSIANSRMQLPPLIHDLEIDYTGLSFAAPEKVRFRYMLEGLDRDGQDAEPRRQAFYNNLPPRNYRFRVIASNNSGVWNEAGASMDFAVAPAYYQTTWFRLSVIAAFLLLLAGLYQLKLRQVASHFE